MAQNVVINGVTYSAVPEVDIPKAGGGSAPFYDTSDADASQGDVLSGKTYYKDGKKTGSMANNGDTSGNISTKAGTVIIPAGYTSGGTVAIDSTEQAKIIAGNIKSGVTILGQAGSSMVVDTTISSGAASASTIVSGYSAYVNGAKIDGSATLPVISQDSTTKVLSIS
jgi:hypothetical protein